MFTNFDYVVAREVQNRICFGSTQLRNTSLLQHKLLKVGPCSYDIKSGFFYFLNKIRSKKGVGSLVNGAPRFDYRILDQIPSPTRYNTAPKWPPHQAGNAPFDIKSKRFLPITNRNPGPGTYDLDTRRCRRTRLDYNFGKPTVIQTVEEICASNPTDACNKCGGICEGDYWQQNHNLYLCELCMAEEIRLHEMFTRKQLRQFKKMRNCGYMHRHEGTTAAIRLLPARLIRKKHQLENYLDLYITC